MNQRLYQLIDEYLDREAKRMAFDVMLGRRMILEDFIFYLDERKGKDWDIATVTETDTQGYYEHLERNSNRYGETLLAMKIVFQFLSFAGGEKEREGE